MRDILDLGVPAEMAVMNIVAIDAAGNHCGVTTNPKATYAVWDGAGEPQTLPPTLVSP